MRERIRDLNRHILTLGEPEERRSYLENQGALFEELKNSPEVFIDSRDWTLYSVVKIGDDYWLGENLRYDCGEGCYACDNDPAPKRLAGYGRLYTRAAATRACPDGWELPDSHQWKRLLLSLGGYLDVSLDHARGADPQKAHAKLQSPDSSALCLTAGGEFEGRFQDLGQYGYYWSSTSLTSDSESEVVSIMKGADTETVINRHSTETALSCRFIRSDSPAFRVRSLCRSLARLETAAERQEYLAQSGGDVAGLVEAGYAFLDPRDYNLYSVIHIGKQRWLGENLRFECGDGGFPYEFEFSGVGVKRKTMLYTPEAARTVPPPGCHLPSLPEWLELINQVGGECDDGAIGNPREAYIQLIDGGLSGFNAVYTGSRSLDSGKLDMEDRGLY